MPTRGDVDGEGVHAPLGTRRGARRGFYGFPTLFYVFIEFSGFLTEGKQLGFYVNCL